MGIMSDGINGGFSGKTGSVVGYYRMGKWVIRGLPKFSKKNKIGSPAQKASRSNFTKIQHFLSPILPLIRIGFNLEGRSKQMTAHNAAKSYNMLNAITPDGEIDCAKVLISCGKLPVALNPSITTDELGLHFTWSNNSKEKGAAHNDQVIVLAYHTAVDRPIAYGFTGARRSKGKETIEIPHFGSDKKFHVWIAFIADDREQVSKSTYLGEIAY